MSRERWHSDSTQESLEFHSMFSFDSSSFAIAGAIAAAGPILIHLLNRRRFKTVNWAAMDFLREALERNRQILQIRDILLLALRMLAVTLFGFALAKPYFKGVASGAVWQSILLFFCLLLAIRFSIGWATSSKGRANSFFFLGMVMSLIGLGFQFFQIVRQSSDGDTSAANLRVPVHAVLVVDNSRSLGVETLGGTLLDRAKGKASEFIDTLPAESRITVIPLAGSEVAFSFDAYRNKEDARHALDRVKLVDTEGSIRSGLEQAARACQQTVDLPTKRVVLLTDLQANAWKAAVAPELLQRLSGLQIVNVTTSPSRNVWVSGVLVEDGLASAEVPCRILGRISASEVGNPSKPDGSDNFEVQAKLLIDGVEVASQTVELTTGQEREIEFTHQFDQLADPLKPGSAVATITVQSDSQSVDQLPSDNRQQIVVPIVASLPVIFVDQFGDEENLDQGKIGETYALRHLMAPRASSDKSQRRLIHVEHVRPEQLTQELLETARLVVMGGIEKPDEALVSLLHDFVQQGGPLVILAGGQFDPAAWSERAWLAGRGILPVPFEAKPFGYTPDEAPQQLQPFYVAFASMQHDFFLVKGEEASLLASLFETTPFFKAVQADVRSSLLSELKVTDTKRLLEEKRFLDQYAARNAAPDGANISTGRSQNDEQTFREIEPSWWNWRSPLPLVDRSVAPEELANQCQPRVLASFDRDQHPFVVERRIGAGRVILFTSGVTSNWNLLRTSGAMYVFHRTFCQLIEQTLPARTFQAGQKITLPTERRSDLRYLLTRPSGVKEPLTIDAISASASGFTVRRPVLAGTYAIAMEQSSTSSSGTLLKNLDEIVVAVNGAESESDLTVMSASDLQQKLGPDAVRVLAANEPIRLEGGARRGQDLWKAFAWCVLACLLVEKLILAWPMLRKASQ